MALHHAESIFEALADCEATFREYHNIPSGRVAIANIVMNKDDNGLVDSMMVSLHSEHLDYEVDVYFELDEDGHGCTYEEQI